MERDKGSYKAFYAKYLKEITTLTGMLPVEKKTLTELLREKEPIIRLRNGGFHKIDRKELEKAGKSVPWYLHSFVKAPIVLVKKTGENRFEVAGDKWEKTLVSYLLKKDDLLKELEMGDVEELLKNYKSLIFISLTLE